MSNSGVIGSDRAANSSILDIERAANIRRFRRVIPVHQSNRAILTAFFTTSIVGFLIIYIEVSRLLIPDTHLTVRELRHLTQGFANDMHWSHDRLPPHPAFSRRRPSAILIGVRYCGAQHLMDLMALHPDLIINRKDIRFFEGNHTDKWYISKMPLTLPHQIIVDVSLNYISNPDSLKAIREYDSNIRVIVTTCHPITRLLLHDISDHSLDTPQKSSSTNGSTSYNTRDKYSNFTSKIPLGNLTIDNVIRQSKNDTTKINSNHKLKKDGYINRNTRSIPRPVSSKNINHKNSGAKENKAKVMENIVTSLESKIFNHDEKGNMTLSNRLLTQNGDYMIQLSKLYEIFPADQVQVVNMDEFYSRRSQWTHLLQFLHVKYKDFSSSILENASSDITKVNISTENFLHYISLFYDCLRLEHPELFQRLDDFYSPTVEEYLFPLNKSL